VNRLSLHEVVMVSAPHGLREDLAAIVLAFSERGVTLQALDKDKVLRLRDTTPDSFVTFRHEKALVALPGTLYRLKPIGDLRFQVSERSMYRSRGSRVTFAMPVVLSHDSSATQSAGTTVNIGPDGLLIETALTAAVGDRMNVSLASPQTDESVSGLADVVRAGDGLVALHLQPESSDVRNVLGNIVVAVSRSELARKVGASEAGPGF
jgi:hypothetical protein